MGWWNSAQRRNISTPGIATDVHDTKLWEHFTTDPQMQAGSHVKNIPNLPESLKSGTGLNLAFVGCDDGVSPWKDRGNYSYNPFAIGCLNLPPWMRHQMAATSIVCIPPGRYNKFDIYVDIYNICPLLHLYRNYYDIYDYTFPPTNIYI